MSASITHAMTHNLAMRTQHPLESWIWRFLLVPAFSACLLKPLREVSAPLCALWESLHASSHAKLLPSPLPCADVGPCATALVLQRSHISRCIRNIISERPFRLKADALQQRQHTAEWLRCQVISNLSRGAHLPPPHCSPLLPRLRWATTQVAGLRAPRTAGTSDAHRPAAARLGGWRERVSAPAQALHQGQTISPGDPALQSHETHSPSGMPRALSLLVQRAIGMDTGI